MTEGVLKYNQMQLETALQKVADFQANLGGTEILKALEKAFNLETP